MDLGHGDSETTRASSLAFLIGWREREFSRTQAVDHSRDKEGSHGERLEMLASSTSSTK